MLERFNELKQKVEKMENRLNIVTNELISLKLNCEGYCQVRSRFISIFLRDKLHKISRIENQRIKLRNYVAHNANPLVDAYLFETKMRHDDNTNMLLYDLS